MWVGLKLRAVVCASLGLLVVPRSAHAQARSTLADSDRYELTLRSESYAELFRRALLPGPGGAIVQTDTVAPVHQYLLLRAREVDTALGEDSVDVELAAWGRAWFGEPGLERRFDGDLQTANATARFQALSLRLGRQQAAGGAARYVRFDGATLGADLGAGFDAEAYGGFTVLPRWNAKPGYHHLGSAADSLLKDPEALPDPERSGHVLGGGRFGWASQRARVQASFHEQHEPAGLTRRTIGLGGQAYFLREAAFGANALMELDARRLQEGRVWIEATPAAPIDASIEYLRSEPALFLSRQSVLSVFSTDAYDEVGGSVVFRVTDRLAFEGNSALELYDADRRGARGEIAVRVFPGAGRKTLVRTGYTRVLAVGNGYHSLRASLARRIVPTLTGTLEAYSYLYDEPIQNRTTSEVYGGSLSYQAADAVNLLWGASVAQSPYAAFDAQTIVRVTYDWDLAARSGAR
jgi:hypothetical protein